MATTPTTTTTTPPSTPIILNIDYLNDSWCELQYKSSCSSTGSISHLNHTVNPEVLEKLLQEAQRESTTNFFPLFKNPTANSNNLDEFDQSSSVNMISDILSSPSSLSSTKNVNINNNNDSCCRNNKISCSNMSSSQQDISCSANTIKMAPDAIRMSEQNLENDGDDDLDLEYMEEDDGVVGNNASSNSSHDSTDSNIIIVNKSQKLNENVNNCDQCKHCSDHKKQIELLIEKQIFSEKQLIKLRKEYEDKLLMSKSLSISSTSSYSATSTPPSLNMTKNTGANTNNSNLTNNLINNETNLNNNNNNDWMKYWSSRPQINPPKEWNFVHPNSSKSKLNNLMTANNNSNNEDLLNKNINSNFISSKLLNKDSISKLIFTHMASFILGATLMFLVFRKHLNLGSSIYFI